MQRRRKGDCKERDARRDGKGHYADRSTIAMPLLRVQAFTCVSSNKDSNPCAMVEATKPADFLPIDSGRVTKRRRPCPPPSCALYWISEVGPRSARAAAPTSF